MRTTSLACLAMFTGIGVFFACSTGGSSGGGGLSPTPTNTGGGGTVGPIINPTPSGSVDTSNLPAPLGCGNQVLTKDESCDDGNTVSGDGCAANCLQVELGYSCVPAGQPCHQIARCGDSVLVFPELCDDGNKNDGDGCSSGCKVEIGFKCSSTPSQCEPTTCGDNNKEGAESCEDGNSMPFDGCSADCQNEPQCGS